MHLVQHGCVALVEKKLADFYEYSERTLDVLVHDQVFYTFSSFFLVAHPPLVSDGAAFGFKFFNITFQLNLV